MIYNILESDWETFQKLFPEATEEDWEELQMIPYTMIQEEVQKYGQTVSKFRHVWIDEEYFNWSRNLVSIYHDPSIALTEEYMDSLDDENVIRLFEKNEEKSEILTFLLPIAFYSMGRKIPREIAVHQSIQTELMKMFSRHFRTSKENVFISHKMYKMDDYFEFYYDYFYDRANKHFSKSSQQIPKPKLTDSSNDLALTGIRLIPIAIRVENIPIITWEEVEKKVFYEDFMISEKNIKNVFEMLKHSFRDKFFFDLYRFILDEEECESFYDDFSSFANGRNIANRLRQKQGKLLKKNKKFKSATEYIHFL